MVREAEISACSSTMKFLCSYGGRVLPRRSDGKLRYLGGFTRILSVPRTVSFAELMVKLEEFCGFSVTLRCQLPDGNLETLISVKTDEDLANIVEEYVRASPKQKIRAVLSPTKSFRQVSPPQSTVSSVNKSPVSCVSKSPVSGDRPTSHYTGEFHGRRSRSPARRFPVGFNALTEQSRYINPRYYALGRPTFFCSAPCCCCCNYSARARLPEKQVQRNLRIN